MASAVVELNQPTIGSSLASKPTRSHSHVQTIDSSPLDNLSGDPKKNEAAAISCNHFSIRGYVIERRKRDPKLCDPFSPYGVQEGALESNHNLPPMVIPKFRWWKCGGCVPGSNGLSEIGKQAKSSADDKLAHLSMQLIEKEANIEASREENAEVASTSSQSKNGRHCSPSAIVAVDRKGKGKVYVEDEILEHQTGCKEHGIIESHQKSSTSDGRPETSKDCMDHENEEARLILLPDLNEGNKAHSNEGDHDEILVFENGIVGEEEDDYLGVDRRKAPKVRLLSELLGLKDIQKDAKLKKVRSAYCEISESESDDESTEIISEALVKKRSKSMSDEKAFPEKRNNKKTKTDHGGCSLMSQIKITPKSSNEKGKSSEKNHASIDDSTVKQRQELYSDQVADFPRKSDVSADLDEKRSALAKRRGKMVQAVKEQTPLTESDVLRKASQNCSEHVRNELNKDGCVRTENDRVNVTSGDSGFYHLPSSTEPIIMDFSVVRKLTVNSCINTTSTGFWTSGGAPVTQSQFDETSERITGPKVNSKGMQVRISSAAGGSPLVQQNTMQVSSSLTTQKEQTRRIQDIDINSIPTDDKPPGPGKIDDSHDIPMDIVELMAKNQYERNLGDTRDRHHSTSLSENARSNGSTSTFGEHMPNLKRPHFLSWRNPSPKDDRNNVTNAFEAADSSKQKLLSCFSEFNQTHLSFSGHISKNHASAKSLTFSQGQERNSAFNLTANNWTGHMEAKQRCSPSFLQTMGSYNACHTAASPRPNLQSHVWPSVVGGSNGKSHHQRPNILNFGTLDLEKQINFSNSYNGGYKQKAAGPVDLYSNEVIPAMHLLSLMQNAGKSEPLKRAPSLLDQQYKHNTSNESRHSLLENNGRTSTVQDRSIHPCYPTLPTLRSLASSFQSPAGTGSKNGFLAPIPLTSLGQRNILRSHFASLRPQRPGSCNSGSKRPLDSGLNKDKGKSCSSNLPFSTNPYQGTNSGNHSSGLATKRNNKTLCPSPHKEICTLNQNPSEFNDMKELRKYMIKPEDLRPRKTGHEKPVPQGNAKREEMKMDKPIISCLIKKIAT